MAVVDSVQLAAGLGLLGYVRWPFAVLIGFIHLVIEVSVMLFLYCFVLDWIAARKHRNDG